MDAPANVLRVGRVRNAPAVNVKSLAELRGLWLLTTPTTLNLTGVKVLQNTAKTEGGGVKESRWGQRGGGGVREVYIYSKKILTEYIQQLFSQLKQDKH